MPKRVASSSNLSGGTGDVNPQTFVIRCTQSAADTTTAVQVPLPVPRYPGATNRAIVMEVLDVEFIISDLTQSGATQFITATLSTRTVSATPFLARIDTAVIAQFSKDFLFATAVGFQYTDRDVRIDLTDAAGHGILVATDQMVLTVFSTATGVVNDVGARITYRLKEIGLPEYIGIVQSQQ